MKRTALLLAMLLALSGAVDASRFLLPGPVWEAGVYVGLRSIKDSSLRAIYGNGTVYTPYLSAAVSPSLRLGVEYEGGYEREAQIGIFDDPSALEVRGLHLFVQYGERTGTVQPYLKLGTGMSFYKLDIESPYVTAYKVSSNDISFFLGTGLRIALSKRLSAAVELKYVALWADPFDDLVDLGGIRALVGIGFGI